MIDSPIAWRAASVVMSRTNDESAILAGTPASVARLTGRRYTTARGRFTMLKGAIGRRRCVASSSAIASPVTGGEK